MFDPILFLGIFLLYFDLSRKYPVHLALMGVLAQVFYRVVSTPFSLDGQFSIERKRVLAFEPKWYSFKLCPIKSGGGALMKERRLKLGVFGAETLAEVARQNGGTNETAPSGAVEVGGGILRGRRR